MDYFVIENFVVMALSDNSRRYNMAIKECPETFNMNPGLYDL